MSIRVDAACVTGPETRLGLAQIVGQLAWRRTDAHRALCAELDHPWYPDLLRSLERFTDDPPFTGRGSLAAITVKQHFRARRLVANISDPASDAELHRIRKAVKRSRAAAELGGAAGIPGCRSYAIHAARLQDTLGDHQDAVVVIQTLAAMRSSVSGSEAYPAIGKLTECQVLRRIEARQRFPERWRRLNEAAEPISVAT